MFEIGIILVSIIVIGCIDIFVYLKIKENFVQSEVKLNEEFEIIQREYEKEKEELKNLKLKHEELEREYVRIKNLEAQKRTKKSEQKITELDVLIKERIVTKNEIKKAQDFIKNNGSSFSVVDALLLLGKIDLKTAEYVRSKVSGES